MVRAKAQSQRLRTHSLSIFEQRTPSSYRKSEVAQGYFFLNYSKKINNRLLFENSNGVTWISRGIYVRLIRAKFGILGGDRLVMHRARSPGR